MDDQRLQALVDELDRMVPREGAVVWEEQGLHAREDDDDTVYCGNRLGYLRLGIELLKVADAPGAEDEPTRVPADLGYLVNADGMRREPAVFERRDIDPSELLAMREPPGRAALALGCFVGVPVALFVVASLWVGAATLLGRIVHLFTG
jgi:hypothetical protein